MSFNRFSTRLGLESLGDRLCPSSTGLSMGKVSWSPPSDVSRIEAVGTNDAAPASDDVIVDGRIITGENYDSAAIAFVGGWGSSMYQYAYNDPAVDEAPDDLASDENVSHGYIKIKKLNSGG